MTKRRRFVVWGLAGVIILVLLVITAGLVVLQSDWFREKVRARIVDELELATGGKVEIGRFDFDWTGMMATVSPLIIRGTEPAGAAPLLRAESIQIVLKIVSALKRDVDLHSVTIDRPAVNLIVRADGSTNIPEPKLKRPKSEQDPIEQILELAVREFTIRDGRIQVAEQRLPLDVRGENLNVKFLYETAGPRYRGTVAMRQLQVDSPAIDPLGMNVDVVAVLEKGKVTVESGKLETASSRVQLSGTFVDFNNPRATANINAALSLPEFGPLLTLRPPYRGLVNVAGTARYSSAEGVAFNVGATGDDVSVRQDDLSLAGNVSLRVEGSYRDALAARLQLGGRGLTVRQGTLTARGGAVSLNGEASYRNGESYALTGFLSGSDLDVRQGTTRIDDARLTANVQLDPGGLALKGVKLAALGGGFQGNVALPRFERYDVDGQISGLSLQRLAALQGTPNVAYSGTVSGRVKVAGPLGNRPGGLLADADLRLAPGTGPLPLQGNLRVGYDGRTGAIRLNPSELTLPNSRLSVSGTLGQALQVSLQSRNLDDFKPALALAGVKPESIPVSLRPGGSASFQGTVTGTTTAPQVAGRLAVTQFAVQNRPLDSLVADIQANRSQATVQNVVLAKDTLRLQGQASVGLQNFKPVDASPVQASVTLRGADVERLLAENGGLTAGQPAPVSGVLAADLQVQGTVGAPQAQAKLNLERPVVAGEQLDEAQAALRYVRGQLDLTSATARKGEARLTARATYTHQPDQLTTGRVRFDVASTGVALNQFEAMRRVRQDVNGQLALSATGEATVTEGRPALAVLNGDVSARNLIVNGRPIGNLAAKAQTAGTNLTVNATGDLRGTAVQGNATVALTGDYPGQGQVEVGALRFETIEDLLTAFGSAQDLPVAGQIAVKASFNGPLTRPDALRAAVEIPTLEIRPDNRTELQTIGNRQATSGAAVDLVLRNDGPIVFELNGQTVNVRSARLTGPETRLELAGTASLNEREAWNLRANGDVNLTVLQTLVPDLTASGRTTLDATVRGTVQQPQVNGKLELREANLNYADAPLGLENANGVVTFDRNRATIQRLTAQSGGGTLSASGFVAYANSRADFRLQATAESVRVRTEGVSVTSDAQISLTGSTDQSLVTGAVTVRRAGVTPSTDAGGLLASSAEPVSTPSTPNEILRNMRLDVAVNSVPNLQFTTSLASDVQADIDLRLKGTAARPAVLGRVLVNQGQANFFGNNYTINRGEIGFYNPTAIEPVLNLDVETIARGTTVNISVGGSIRKLNISYRSDPPLSTNEIISLLALGRTPDTSPGLASSQTVAQQSFVQTGANSLLGAAVASPVSNRLQRFFGVSRLKIDPLLTGVDSNALARLTIEQNLSRDVTVLFITNLANAQQQVVRLQWDLTKTWSVVAVRDENGIFGIDFQFRKRFR